MSDLTRGRIEPCKNSLGGVKELWLTSFVPYSHQLILGYRQMVIYDFPQTLMYEFKAQNKEFSETLNENGNYDQQILFRFTGQSVEDAQAAELLAKKSLRAIVIDYNDKIRVFGLHNGLTAEVSGASGGPKSSFLGYDIVLSGIEELAAPFLENFPGAGFEKEGLTYGCFLASSSIVASTADKIASCEVIENPADKPPVTYCYLSGDGLKLSTETLISQCD